MGDRIFTISTDDGISRDVEASHFKTKDDRTVTFYHHHEYATAAMFNLDHVISVVALDPPDSEE